jgi:hypothetical protein
LGPTRGRGSAQRAYASMLQHCLSKQTLRLRDCEPLECHKPTSPNRQVGTFEVAAPNSGQLAQRSATVRYRGLT